MKEIGGGRVYRKWKEWEEGEYVQGTFEDKSLDDYNKPNYALRLTEYFIGDEDWLAENKVAEGTVIGLNSNGSLDMKMDQVEFGEEIRVQYDGMDIAKKGKYKGKEFHKVKVFMMDDNATLKTSSSEPSEGSEVEDDPFAGL